MRCKNILTSSGRSSHEKVRTFKKIKSGKLWLPHGFSQLPTSYAAWRHLVYLGCFFLLWYWASRAPLLYREVSVFVKHAKQVTDRVQISVAWSRLPELYTVPAVDEIKAWVVFLKMSTSVLILRSYVWIVLRKSAAFTALRQIRSVVTHCFVKAFLQQGLISVLKLNIIHTNYNRAINHWGKRLRWKYLLREWEHAPKYQST